MEGISGSEAFSLRVQRLCSLSASGPRQFKQTWRATGCLAFPTPPGKENCHVLYAVGGERIETSRIVKKEELPHLFLEEIKQSTLQ